MMSVIIKTQFSSAPNNVISEDIKKIFSHQNFIQHFFLSPKFVIKDERIYTIGLIYNITVVFFLIIIITFWCPRFNNFNSVSLDFYGFHEVATAILFYFYVGSLIALYIFNSLKTNSYGTLILKIQFIKENLNFREIKKFIIWSWVSNVLILLGNLALMIGYSITFHYIRIIDPIVDTLLVTFDIHFIYSLQFIIILIKYQTSWNDTLLKNIEDENDEYWMNMFEIYKSIIEVYDLYKKLFQILVRYRIFLLLINIVDGS